VSRDDDVDVSTQVPEADAAEQQIAIDTDDWPDLDSVADAREAFDQASEGDLIEQAQTLPGEEEYPTPTPTSEPRSAVVCASMLTSSWRPRQPRRRRDHA